MNLGENEEFDVFVEQNWEAMKDIILNPDGTINMNRLKKEISDYVFLMQTAAKVYHLVTGGLFKTCGYEFDQVKSAYEGHVGTRIEKAVENAINVKIIGNEKI
jgi:hypothetical protein